jgi:fructose-1,6-bisphosphatase/inositol monophosphatase family enzyme
VDRAAFPDYGILGKEFGQTRPEAPRRCLVDPIDGTKSVVRGVPLWGSLVALGRGRYGAGGRGVLSGAE